MLSLLQGVVESGRVAGLRRRCTDEVDQRSRSTSELHEDGADHRGDGSIPRAFRPCFGAYRAALRRAYGQEIDAKINADIVINWDGDAEDNY